MIGRFAGFVFRFIKKTILIVTTVIVTVIVFTAFYSRQQPELEIWHTTRLENRFDVDKMPAGFDFEDYLELEDALFEEIERRVVEPTSSSEDQLLNRYNRQSPMYPVAQDRDWNRSFELRPDEVRGGVLLLHGLTDSPYSMRAMAETFANQGFYVLAPRLPGHGTIPRGLLESDWEDWRAVVRLGMRHLRNEVGAELPLFIGGYSNGGALAVNHVLEAIENPALVKPDRVVLMSPAIAITPLAIFANWNAVLSFMPYFEQFKWSTIFPEFDPWKYNSFATRAGHGTRQLTLALYANLERLTEQNRLDDLPPILTFQSLVDATVSARAVAQLYETWPTEGSELVVFDLNRIGNIRHFLRQTYAEALAHLERLVDRHYSLTLVTNEDPESRAVYAKTWRPGESEPGKESLGTTWPEEVFSLTHVSIPFSADDPWYGTAEFEPERGQTGLGALVLRGERGVLVMDFGQFMRLRHNPFHPYLEKRLIRFIQDHFED